MGVSDTRGGQGLPIILVEVVVKASFNVLNDGGASDLVEVELPRSICGQVPSGEAVVFNAGDPAYLCIRRP
jgi:hypothetical protein